jgi:hypothetical protein
MPNHPSDDPPLHGNYGSSIEQVARDLIARRGTDASRYARGAAAIVAGIGDEFSAEVWRREIADAIDRLQSSETGAPGSVPVARHPTNATISAL